MHVGFLSANSHAEPTAAFGPLFSGFSCEGLRRTEKKSCRVTACNELTKTFHATQNLRKPLREMNKAAAV